MNGKKWVVPTDDLFIAARTMACTYMKYCRDAGTSCNVFGVPSSGIPAAYLFMLAMATLYPKTTLALVDSVSKADVIIDDIIDSGKMRVKYARYRGPPFLTLYDKNDKDQNLKDIWVVFPWDRGNKADTSTGDIGIQLLKYIGEDPEREGLKETPQRFLEAWKKYTSGYQKDPGEVLKTFENGTEDYDEMVLVRDIHIYSHCEHNLAPFFGVAHVAYIPDKRVVGLSNIARVIDIFMRRLQVQERLTSQIANVLIEHLQPKGVAVVLECHHFNNGGYNTVTVTSKMLGRFKVFPEMRDKFMRMIR